MNESVSFPLRVTFYTKAGCHLCEEARDLLEELATRVSYELTEIDIRSDPALFERYRYRIPVILLNETLIAEGRIYASDLERAFDIR
ncbi:MAG: glutaredoxin family protein [Ktedonobacteraceae bacterium]|nr:glutaredoxin family protein [Ktedonobacteraceae bacterium]